MPPRAKVTKKGNAETGKRYPLNMRTTFEMRQSLEEGARRSGRSLAQEAEFRLEDTFRTEDERLLHALFAALNAEPRWPKEQRYEGRKLTILPQNKRAMKLIIGDFIDSLPGPEPSALEILYRENGLAEELQKIAELKKERGIEGDLAEYFQKITAEQRSATNDKT
jgi:TraY domain